MERVLAAIGISAAPRPQIGSLSSPLFKSRSSKENPTNSKSFYTVFTTCWGLRTFLLWSSSSAVNWSLSQMIGILVPTSRAGHQKWFQFFLLSQACDILPVFIFNAKWLLLSRQTVHLAPWLKVRLCNLGHRLYRAEPQWPCATFKLAPVALTPQHLKSSGWAASKTLVTFDICAMKTTTMIMWRWDLWSARENSICWDGANEVSFYFLSLHTHTHTTAQTHIHNKRKCTHSKQILWYLYKWMNRFPDVL